MTSSPSQPLFSWIAPRPNTAAIITPQVCMVDRTSRAVRLIHLPHGHSAEAFTDACDRVPVKFPDVARRTLTWDQGSEMARHDMLSKHFESQVPKKIRAPMPECDDPLIKSKARKNFRASSCHPYHRVLTMMQFKRIRRPMRVVVRSVLVSGMMAASVVSGPTATSSAASSSHQLAIASLLPTEGAVVGVAHPVVITFNSPVVDRRAAERAVDIKSVPAMAGKFEWVENDVARWVPEKFWPAHSTVALAVGNLPTRNFEVGPAVVGVANLADHTFTVTVDGEPASGLPAPHHRPKWGQHGVFPASMGRPEYPTPVGVFSVLAKERDILMDSSSVGIPIDAPDGYLQGVEYAIRFTHRGLFVHSAPWAVNQMGYENGSHGCIGLSTEDAEWYFNTVNVGDPIIVRENGIEVPRSVPG